jgi:A/G-specific adenine glycosylase
VESGKIKVFCIFAGAMSFTTTILQWFEENGRTLPWRETRNPYAIWLSEIILQQTRIEQGRPYWERFMRRWPTVEALAKASEDEVLREWQGLGYYSRARNLHTAAQQVVAMGGFPTTIEGIKALKGVGDYTAAAIGSIAFDLPAAVVDGNVYRVLARHYGIATPINTTEGKKEFTALAQELLPPQQASAFNQAMMDFGAIQCTPQSPLCEQCPLMESCVAFREGRIDELPVKQRTLKIKKRQLTYIYIRCNGYTAIHRRPAGDIWQGLYEPLLLEVRGEIATPHSDLWSEKLEVREMLEALGILSPLTSHLSPLKKNVKHVLTHRILYADFWLWETSERPQLPDDYFWIKEEEIGNYGVPRLIEILLESLNTEQI